MPIKKALPTFYYLDHFHEFLQFFDGPSAALLRPQDRQQIDAFRALSRPQQCVVVRFANRKYPLVRRDQLRYEEIPDITSVCASLIPLGWLQQPENIAPSALHAHFCAEAMNKADIQRLLTCYARTSQERHDLRGDKPQLASRLTTLMSTTWPQAEWLDEWLWFAQSDWLHYLLFLFFGNSRGRLNQFSMRDLGVMNTRGDSSGASPRFTNHLEAQLAFRCAMALDYLSVIEASALWELATSLSETPMQGIAGQWRARFLYQYGCHLLSSDGNKALQLLAWSGSDEAWERWIREQYKRGEKSLVEARIIELLEQGASEHLLTFVEDFYSRKFQRKRTSLWTDWLRQTPHSLALDESYLGNVERGAIRYYHAQGIQAWRTENQLWRDLFALVFWDLLAGPEALVTEFDYLPLSLKENRFYSTHTSFIDDLLAHFTHSNQLIQHVQHHASLHYGKPCALIHWRNDLLQPLMVLCQHVPVATIVGWLRRMAENFRDYQDGYPDIMLLRGNALSFAEIKAPGDQLRRNQLVTLKGLRDSGFDVSVVPVTWVQDPLQPYVVVDIETTGGRSDTHRITEIGMVKVVAGKVVDTWQSLINPERPIPPAITRLTGITNDMVAHAPTFAAVADDVEAFTEDAIFVAHNVNFDYGFIRQEFARLERYYRRPKLCTVQLMRKTHPGLASYALAALSQHFNIPLESHHRALHDAKAAAGLLSIARWQQALEEGTE